MFYFLANSCYKENCYFKMYLVLLLVKCEEDKNRFQKGVEKDLIALSEESIPVKSLIALIQQKVSASLNWNMRLLFTEL